MGRCLDARSAAIAALLSRSLDTRIPTNPALVLRGRRRREATRYSRSRHPARSRGLEVGIGIGKVKAENASTHRVRPARAAHSGSRVPTHEYACRHVGGSNRGPPRRGSPRIDGMAKMTGETAGDKPLQTAARARWARSISAAPTGFRVVIISTKTSNR